MRIIRRTGEGGMLAATWCIASLAGAMLLPAAVLGTGVLLPAAPSRYNQGWVYHREHHLWYVRVANMEPLVKTNAYERGSYLCFNPNTWETVRKDNFVLYYDLLEKRPALPQH